MTALSRLIIGVLIVAGFPIHAVADSLGVPRPSYVQACRTKGKCIVYTSLNYPPPTCKLIDPDTGKFVDSWPMREIGGFWTCSRDME